MPHKRQIHLGPEGPSLLCKTFINIVFSHVRDQWAQGISYHFVPPKVIMFIEPGMLVKADVTYSKQPVIGIVTQIVIENCDNGETNFDGLLFLEEPKSSRQKYGHAAINFRMIKNIAVLKAITEDCQTERGGQFE